MTQRFIGREFNKGYWQCNFCKRVWITGGSPQFEHVCNIIENGPGTELAIIISRLKIPICQSCVNTKYKMNEWGPVGCRQNIDIIVDDISTRTIVPKYLIKRAILKAIKNYEKKVQDVSGCNNPT